MLHPYGSSGLHDGMKYLIELIDRVRPYHFSLGHGIELFLYARGEVVIHHAGKILHQEIVHHDTNVGRHQLIPVGAYDLALPRLLYLALRQGNNRISALLALFISFHHILAILDCLDRRSVGRRSSDTQLLQAAHQARLRITRRTLGETLGSHGILQGKRLILRDRREQAILLFLLVLIVRAFPIHL